MMKLEEEIASCSELELEEREDLGILGYVVEERFELGSGLGVR